MKKITSKENPTYKLALKLTKRKFRDDTGMYLLEGVKPLADALKEGAQIEYIFIAEGSGAGFIGIELPESRVIALSNKLFAEISDTSSSQGVIAMVQQQSSASERLDALLDKDGRLLVLDRIQDPGNLGTIIRTAEAAGISGVILMHGCVDPYSPKVVRAAAGSLFRVPVIQKVRENELFAGIRRAGRKTYVTALDDAVSYDKPSYDEKSVIVIGNEGRGVSENFKDAADLKIKIPMAGAIESLNAAVAAGILMYESQKKK